MHLFNAVNFIFTKDIPMAASRPTPRSASQSYRRQALIWLVVTLLLGVLTALIWMFSQTPAMGAKIENAPISAPEALSTELEQPLKIESLHELDTDVQPLSFDTAIQDLRNYPDEFKDKGYLLANKGKWTVQVMNVAENDVIISYLEGRKDRSKFAYFRYLDDEKQMRYMLTYGLMSSPQEAVGAAKLIDFRLPADVRVLPEEINRYVGIIDNYTRADPMRDLSTKRTRSIDLEPTKREVPVRQKKPVTETAESNTNGNESIRQSADTSDTLSVNEQRTVVNEEQSSSVTTTKDDGATSKAEQDNKKPASGADTTTPKPPVVPTPKPPTANPKPAVVPVPKTPSTANSANSSNTTANAKTPKNGNDSIKALIEAKSN